MLEFIPETLYFSFIIFNFIDFSTEWLHSILTSCVPSAFFITQKRHKHGPKGVVEARISFFLKFAYQNLLCSISHHSNCCLWGDPSREKSLSIIHVSEAFIYSLKNKIAINQEENEMAENEEKNIISLFQSCHIDEGQLWEE